MNTIKPGQRLQLKSFLTPETFRLNFNLQAPGGIVIDSVCFGLDSAERLSDDRYMTFFNQPETPCGGVKLQEDGSFLINLAKLPKTISRLAFTASIDGSGVMSLLENSDFAFAQNNIELAICKFSGQTFNQERAVMLLDIYIKEGAWRCSATLQGFNEGLDALVKHFGGEVASDTPSPEVAPQPDQVSVEKKIEMQAPALVSLAKKVTVCLEKKGLSSVRAKVGLVLDASASMNGQYRRGKVQNVLNRLLPMAVHFDDDNSLDCWAFGSKTQQLSSVCLSNYSNFIEKDNKGWKRWKLGIRINCETSAIQAVIDFYKASDNPGIPVYVLFISDGGVSDDRQMEKFIRDASGLPIFWQFVGIGGRGYGVLEKLDDLTGRKVDNCDFFALDDLEDISEDELYSRLMNEFPGWLKAARRHGILL